MQLKEIEENQIQKKLNTFVYKLCTLQTICYFLYSILFNLYKAIYKSKYCWKTKIKKIGKFLAIFSTLN